MGRKSKQAGSGHLPLSNHERKEYSKPYGTVSKRLGAGAQYTFGHCALSLTPAIDQPVMTPSGFIYERSAILEYLLVKTQQVKQEQEIYEQRKRKQLQIQQQKREEKQLKIVQEFQDSQRRIVGGGRGGGGKTKTATSSTSTAITTTLATTTSNDNEIAARAATTQKRKRTDDGDDDDDNDTDTKEDNPLKRTSFWLAEFQPIAKNDDELGLPPPERPISPNSEQPLRRKDLIPLELLRNADDQVICAISQKSIVTQPALALVGKISSSSSSSSSGTAGIGAQVVLEQVYNDIMGKNSTSKDNKKERTICPVTGRKIIKVIQLQRGGSSFASSGGQLEAKIYRHTMT